VYLTPGFLVYRPVCHLPINRNIQIPFEPSLLSRGVYNFYCSCTYVAYIRQNRPLNSFETKHCSEEEIYFLWWGCNVGGEGLNLKRTNFKWWLEYGAHDKLKPSDGIKKTRHWWKVTGSVLMRCCESMSFEFITCLSLVFPLLIYTLSLTLSLSCFDLIWFDWLQTFEKY